MTDLTITVDSEHLDARWTDDNPETRQAIAAALPVDGDASRWGDELYFRTPIDVPEENSQVEVPVGGIAYWPQGNALCLFWGPTPASVDDTPRAASAVNLVAMIDNTAPLDEITGGAHVTIAAAD